MIDDVSKRQHDLKFVDKIQPMFHIVKAKIAMLNRQIMMQMFVLFQMLIWMFSNHSKKVLLLTKTKLILQKKLPLWMALKLIL